MRTAGGGPRAATLRAYLEGRLLELEGRREEALARLEDAAHADPDSAEPAMALASALEAAQRIPEASARLEQLVARCPEASAPYIAWLALELGPQKKPPASLSARLPRCRRTPACDFLGLIEALDRGGPLCLRLAGSAPGVRWTWSRMSQDTLAVADVPLPDGRYHVSVRLAAAGGRGGPPPAPPHVRLAGVEVGAESWKPESDAATWLRAEAVVEVAKGFLELAIDLPAAARLLDITVEKN